MNEFHIVLPDDLVEGLRRESDDEQVPVAEVIAAAVRNHLSAREQIRQLQRRAANGKRASFLKVLDAAPDVEPEAADRIEAAR